MTDFKALLRKLRENRNTLEARKARWATDPPLGLLNQIADHKQAIDLTEQVIAGHLTEAQWREKLKPLLVAIDERAASSEICQVTLGDIGGDVRDAIIAGRDVHVTIYNYPPPPAPPVTDADTAPDDAPIAENPYRGLFAFRPEHSHLFFGRETFTRQLVQATTSRSLVAVLGASGSGKSSVVFAGLVPALLARSDAPWQFTTFRPGTDPFFGLAQALVPLIDPGLSKIKQTDEARDFAVRLREGRSRLADHLQTIHDSNPDRRLLIIADQFEELFTLCKDTDTHHAFLNLLLAALPTPNSPFTIHHSPFTIVLTLRADFLGQASLYRPLADALQGTTELLGPMTRSEMTEAIEKPAALHGVQFEANLVERLLDDVGQEEGSLPLLEFALTELWRHQQQGSLTHTAYEEIGRVEGALSRHADEAYRRLTPAEKEQARRVFVQLVNPGVGTEDTRRLATRTELEPNWPLVTRLANERLVVTNQTETDQDTVEVVHEALIRHWQQLRAWMEKDRDFRTWQEWLRFAMNEWQDTRDDGALLRGASLAEAENWLAERPTDLSEAEAKYIEAGLTQRRRQEQRQRVILGASIAAAIVMTALAIFSYLQFQAATRAEIAAQAQLDFSQATDAAGRVDPLATLLDFERADVVTRLFWELAENDQLDLLRVQDGRMAEIIESLSVTLADVNRTGRTGALLATMVETLAADDQESALEDELAQWLRAREKPRDRPDETTLAEYDRLIALNDRNPATRYERATVLLAFGRHDAALQELEQVLALADDPAFPASGLVDSGTDFATVEQVTRAVRRLLEISPELGAVLNQSAAEYPQFQQFNLVREPTPTPVTDKHGSKMVLVPAGPFMMGSNSSRAAAHEGPVHAVNLTYDFYIDQYEVTNDQFIDFLEAEGNQDQRGSLWYDPDWGQLEKQNEKWQVASELNNHPVTGVSWYGARAYCTWRGARLPTEAEWEKAARGTDGRTYPFGEVIAGHLARYSASEVPGTAPAGHYDEGISPYGAYDMAGNVWEWVADSYDNEYYKNSPDKNPTGPENDEQNISSKVLRGGSWLVIEPDARATFRDNFEPNYQGGSIGFRCAAGSP